MAHILRMTTSWKKASLFAAIIIGAVLCMCAKFPVLRQACMPVRDASLSKDGSTPSLSEGCGHDCQPSRAFLREIPTARKQCHNIPVSMVKGQWQTRNVSSSERTAVQLFYKKIRKSNLMAENLERSDRKCGNIGFPGAPGWYRALCDVHGDTPCCFNNTCVNKSVQECKCDQCLDLRTSIHAELSTWQTEDPSCQARDIPVDVCPLLKGVHLHFVGDSLMRHLYTAFLLLINGNDVTNIFLDKSTPVKKAADIRKTCSGMYATSESMCLNSLKHYTTMCNGTTNVAYVANYRADHARSIQNNYFGLHFEAKSYMIIGMGLHEQLNASRIVQNVLLPVLRIRDALHLASPRLLWVTPSCPGLLKNGRGMQGKEKVRAYNRILGEFMQEWQVPVLDTFRLTESVVSLDGTHYGLSLNTLVAQMVLHYVLCERGATLQCALKTENNVQN